MCSQCRRQRRRSRLRSSLKRCRSARASWASARCRLLLHARQLLPARRQLRFDRGAGGPERLPLLARLVADFQQPAAALVQPARQLFFLPLQGAAALIQPRLLVGQSRLLGDHGGGLDAQRVALGLDGLFVRKRRRLQPEPERADRDFIAVTERDERSGPVVDENAVADQVAQDEAVGAVDEGGVEGLDALDGEAHLTAGRLAEEGERPGQRPAGAAEPAVDHDQLRGRRGAVG